jgi:hypothetical protein
MRHPNLDKPVFYEVASVSSAWKDKITYSAIFDGYFGSEKADNGVDFFRAILDNVEEGRPVFEECRTAGRIGLLKESLGGFHIYLWRNPWDQWWSYKTIDHLDYQNREIINAPNSFNAITKLRSQLSFQGESPKLDIQTKDGILTSDESYLTFYLLWCLGLYEGVKHAHLMINIDKLKESKPYREQIVASLVANGIDGIDFSDCNIPQGSYFEEDEKFFSPLEDKVHHWLMDDFSADDLNYIQELRTKHQPKTVAEEIKSEQLENFSRQLTQTRAVSRRFETNKAMYLQIYIKSIKEYEKRLELISQEKNKAMETLNKAMETLNDVYSSRSWRITQPVRWLGKQIRYLQLHGLKHLVQHEPTKSRNN